MQARDAGEWSKGAGVYSTGSVAKIPEFFSDVAAHKLLENAQLSAPIQLIDVAGGTGALSREFMNKLSSDQKAAATVEVTDFSQGMLDTAKSQIQDKEEYKDITVNFHVADAQNLQFSDNSFTHLGCMFGVMFFPDRQKSMSEMHRVLKPDGLAAVGTWHYVDNIPLLRGYAAFLNLPDQDKLETTMQGIVSVCGDREVFKSEMLAAGFREVDVVEVDQVFALPNDKNVFMMYAMNAAMKGHMGGEKAPEYFDQWQEYLRTTGARFVNADGSLALRFVCNLAIAKK